MKRIPTVVVSRDGEQRVAVTEFSGSQRVPNRDAVGYYFVLNDSDGQRIRVGVIFSGTVLAIRPEAFELPSADDREESMVTFALAAMGDHLEEEGLPPPTGAGEPAHHIECFSPHFQSWKDRAAATDELVEAYLQHHVFWAWKFDQKLWELGLSDLIRLGRTMEGVERLVALGEGHEWEVEGRSEGSVALRASRSLIRMMRGGNRPHRALAKPEGDETESEEATEEPAAFVFVDGARVSDLRRLSGAQYDLRKVVALAEELNVCYRSQCYHAVAALTRSLIDHVPPIFGCNTFAEVANNYGGGKSFKDCMQRLETTARSISDLHLHQRIRSRESLPTRTQVNFSNELDLLLAEIVRILEPSGGRSA